jgi:septin family protein
MPEGNAVFPRSHVGFDSITQQIEKKLLKRGFQFNVICVGMFYFSVGVICFLLTLFYCRSNWSREIYSHQHHIRITPYRLERPSQARSRDEKDYGNRQQITQFVLHRI